MPLFSNIEDANIYGGTYYEVGGDVYHFTTVEFHGQTLSSPLFID